MIRTYIFTSIKIFALSWYHECNTQISRSHIYIGGGGGSSTNFLARMPKRTLGVVGRFCQILKSTRVLFFNIKKVGGVQEKFLKSTQVLFFNIKRVGSVQEKFLKSTQVLFFHKNCEIHSFVEKMLGNTCFKISILQTQDILLLIEAYLK